MYQELDFLLDQTQSYLQLYESLLRAKNTTFLLNPLWQIVCDYTCEDARIVDLFRYHHSFMIGYHRGEEEVVLLNPYSLEEFYRLPLHDWHLEKNETIYTLLMIPGNIDHECNDEDIYVRRILYAILNNEAPPIHLLSNESSFK